MKAKNFNNGLLIQKTMFFGIVSRATDGQDLKETVKALKNFREILRINIAQMEEFIQESEGNNSAS